MTVPSGDRTPGGGLEMLAVETEGRDHALVPRFWLLVVTGPDSGATFTSTGERTVIGSYDSADLVLRDPTVSRFHCEIAAERGRLVLRDLGSLNGTTVNGVAVGAAELATGATITVGRTQLRFDVGSEQVRLPVSPRTGFGALVGRSTAMRRAFAVLERAAATDATVLIEGEPGTGKEAAAESIHRESARRDGPFIVVACGAGPADVLEPELFGHQARAGGFAAAHGGTVVLDEIGDLPLELQAKLVRVLERREVKRVGATSPEAVDVRAVATSSRNLRADVNAKRFRADLYYRLAGAVVRLPPLRDRLDDLALLVEHLAAGRAPAAELAFGLAGRHWPGNVRELGAHIERLVAARGAAPPDEGDDGEPGIDPARPLEPARAAWVRAHERRYVAALLQRHGDDLTAAAHAAGVDRIAFRRLLGRPVKQGDHGG